MTIVTRGLPAAAVMFLAACSHDLAGIPSVSTRATGAKLAFTVRPSNATAGAAFTPAVAVTIEDSAGHPVPSATNAVTVVLDTNPGGRLSGTTTVTAVNGVATFENLSIQKAGSGYTVTASSGGLMPATSTPFAIAPAAPAQLSFTTQPSTTWDTQPITPAVQVAIEDAFANAVPSATNAVKIAIGTNPGAGTLSGTTIANPVSGVATFTNLGIDGPGSGYTLVASARGLTGAVTAPFAVTLAPASIIIVSGNGQSGWMGCLLWAPLVVQVNDGNDQPVAGVAVSGGFGTTGTNGQAQTGWVLGWHLGLQTRTASVTNVGSVTFSAYANFHDGPCPPAPQPPTPRIGLSPATVTFTATHGGANPTPQTVSVTNGGGGTLSGLAVGTISYVKDSTGLFTGWLSASLSGSTAPVTLNLNATIGTLAPGTYSATVPVISSVAYNSPQYVLVILNVR